MKSWFPATRNSNLLNPWFEGLQTLHSEIDRWFEDLTRRFPDMGLAERARFFIAPRVDVYETDSDVIVSAELPGVDSKDLDVTVYPQMVVIKAEKKQEEEIKEENRYHAERYFGRIERTVSLPADVDPDKVKASFKNGLLKLTLPKVNPTKQGRKINLEQ